MENDEIFYDLMFSDKDESYELLPSISIEKNNADTYKCILDLDNDNLISFLQNHSITHEQFFCAGFAYTLSRFTGYDKVLFNLTQSNTNSTNTTNQPMPILVDCKNQSIDAFLEYCSRLIISTRKHSSCPYEVLEEKYKLNVNISFQYTKNKKDLTNKSAPEKNCDFSFLIYNPEEDIFNIKVSYSAKYDLNFIKRFVDSFKSIITGIVNVESLSEITYTSKDDLKLLDKYNKTEHQLKYNDILDAFNENLSKYPENKLVSMNKHSYTYGEGAFIANKIANALKELGIESSNCVSFLVEESELYLFNTLAIMSIGATFVPLDANLPDKRIKFILNDTKSKVVIVNDKSYERANDLTNDNVILLNISNIVNGKIKSLKRLPVVYGNLACILYTSGTTGMPKGVKITRKAILNLSQTYVDNYSFTKNDIYGLYASIGFDASYEGIFTTIYTGACLSIIPKDIKLNIGKLNDYFIEENITHTFISTQLGRMFMENVENTSLKLLSVGGEKLGKSENPEDYCLMDGYGPTEAFDFITSIKNEDKISESSIGFLNYNSKAYILDNEFRRIPPGGIGELYLAGYQIADGYLNREKETENAFIANPFYGNKNYNILYRTGDMARILPDGSIGIVGRRDNQVKIRGNRVELSEIEEIIRELDYVKDVTVQAVKNEQNNELVAYVVTSDESENLKDVICDYVSLHKPKYMVPSHVIGLDKIPLTINGKVDKKALPDVDVNRMRADYVAPATQNEKEIVNIFEDVLGQKDIGLFDDFIRLGGDSIKAIRIISLLEKNGITCSARDILNYKTPYLIAQNVKNTIKTYYKPTIGQVELLPIQKFFFDNIDDENYSQEYILKSKIDLDLNTFQSAFNELSNVHDMLRATFKIEEKNVIQEILPLNTCVCEIKEYSADNLNETIREIIEKSKNSLNIGSELIKISIIHHDSECYIVFVIHHLIVDGVSWSILLDDLTQIYTNILENKDINLLRPYPYKKWVDDVKSLAENISDEEKKHWMEVNALLDDSTIKGKSKIFTFTADVHFDADNLLMLSEDEYLALAIARAYKKSYNEDIIFNRETHGRDGNLADIDHTFGWFTSQFPVPVTVNGKYDNISLINDIYHLKKAFKDVKHSGMNYQSLVYTLDEFSYKHCPVTYNFLSTEFSFANELFETVNIDLTSNNKITTDSDAFGIYLKVFRENDSYKFICDYAKDTYLGDRIKEFIENILAELEFIGQYKTDPIICALSEQQLGIYLDEKVNDKNTAYSTPNLLECGLNKKTSEIRAAIDTLIDRHPILKGRVVDSTELPLLVCDSYPSIEEIDTDDYSNLIKPYNLSESLARFYIISNDEGKFIFYDIHHLITDATSYKIINEELFRILEGEFEDIIDLGFYYSSLDSFESKFKDSYAEAHEFYKNNLSSIEDTGTLLSDINGHDNIIELPIRNIKDNVEEFCQKSKITKNSFFNAVFAYCLSRFVGRDNVFYTFNVNGRQEAYTQKAVDMLVYTIPIIVNCENRLINEYLFNVYENVLDSMKYSEYPFRLLAREFNLKNDVAFEYNGDLKNMSHAGDDLIIRDLGRSVVSDFTCAVNDLSDGYLVSITSSAKFSDETIIRFLNAFKEILIQIMDNELLSDIDYLSPSDLEILDEHNKTEHSLKYNDILDAFNDNLSKYPENKLVSMNSNAYTYAQGAFIASEIAGSLKDLGVETGDCVSFLVEQSEQHMFNILAIMSIGATFVPLDTNLPDERIRLILKDTNSKVLIVSDETFKRAENLNSNCIILNASHNINDNVRALSHLNVNYTDLACILYTSGTTGIPKGVRITRKAVVNEAAYFTDTYNLTNEDIYGLYSSTGFDAGPQAIFQSIYAGACLSIIPENIRLDIFNLNRYIVEQNITHTFIPTQVGKLFIDNIDDTTLKILSVGGEKLGKIDDSKNYIVVDEFGPTEAFAFISSIRNEDKLEESSIGFLNYNSKAYILDNEFRRIPPGGTGELYLAGFQIADGYLNQEKQTANAFIANPFDRDENYNIMYRTGDMVRLLPDGSLSFVGRHDNQVKIRGNRVELSEVESIIRELDYVEDVSLQTVKNEENNELVAYVVSNKPDIEDSISKYVANNKPDYMVPSFIVLLDKIPLTINGKVDKEALPEIDLNSLRAEYAAPSTNTEKKIVASFEKVFKQENIGLYDDFIRLGGDSLAAIKLLSHLNNYNISAGDILSLRTPKNIADNIIDQSFDLNTYSFDSGCPLNEAQLNIYLDIKANDKPKSYHIPLITSISKKYDINSITEALNKILDIHPILGMCVSDDFDVPYLIKANKPSISFKSSVDNSTIYEFLAKSFDLNKSLCRFLIVTNENDYTLFAVFHHLIFDGLSYGVFEDDLLAILEGEYIEKDTSFLEISAYNQQIQETEEFEHAHAFYDSMIGNNEDIGVLINDAISNKSGQYNVSLEFNKNSFNNFLNKYGVNENILFTSVFAYTLSRFTGSGKVHFNIIENGRSKLNNFNSIGMFANTLPLVADCKNQDIESFMTYMRDLIYNVMKFNYYPFRLLANEYNINSNIIFQYMPDWFNENQNSLDIYDAILENMEDLINDFTAQVTQINDHYNLNIVYSGKYSKETVERFAKSYELILSQITDANNLSDINYTTSTDLDILNKINETEHKLDYNDIIDAFNDNLSKYPENKLVSMNNNSYTYSEGAFIAGKIANSLKENGIKAGDCVSFLVERSELYMFSVLGILSAGAAYVPLDDAHPNNRIDFILKDTESKAVIVSDETCKRAESLTDAIILNISDMLKSDIGTLSNLPTSYNDLACILYTSGTTGIPKGVKIPRIALLNLSDYYVRNYALTDSDVFGLFSSIGFDAAYKAIFASIYASACLDVIPTDVKLDMSALNNYFIKQGITHVDITTPVAKLLISQVDDISLDVLFTGGEKLGKFDKELDCRFVDGYGPTEAYVEVATVDVANRIDPSSIGHLVDNIKAYILDDERRRVPVGAVGKLYLAGNQISDGYLNRDDETANAFIDNPFDDGDYSTLYCTGDMVRILPDNSLGVVGRLDSQVKIRGNRVELSEIESVIREIEYINDVTVQTINNGSDNELVAYVVYNSDDSTVAEENIKNYILKNKPEYMVPAFIIKLDEIPLNVNSKVDKRALPDVDVDSLRVEYVAPRNEIEKDVVEAFEKVFNQENISLYDNFVHLGGDSIKAIRIISMLAKNNISTTAKGILNYKTPYLIAQNAEKITKTSYEPTTGEVDLLPIQKHFFDEINTNQYSQEFILKFKTDLDLNALQKAFNELVNVHDMLRATYKQSQNKVIQTIQPPNTQIVTIEEYTANEFNLTMGKIIKKSNESLNINDTLIKINLVHYNEESYLVLVIHHLIIDGISWSILIDDLTYLYNQIIKNEEINLSRPYPYKSWVHDVECLAKNISDEEKQHWIDITKQLDDSSIKGNSKVFAFKSEVFFDNNNSLRLSEEEYLALSIARAYKTTYGENIIFNRESHGRDGSLADVSRTIGWFTSQFPVPVEVINKYDHISLMSDCYSLKKAFKCHKHLGLNYESLIYTFNELPYKHCPVTFNFLSTEFIFKNELFESLERYFTTNDLIDFNMQNSISYGISLNISRVKDFYIINGNYAKDTYLGDKFNEFVENIKKELEFIGNYESDCIVCALSELQLGIYLDEKVNDKKTAYSVSGIIECNCDKSDMEIKNAIIDVINKHPILKSRILDTAEMPLLVCDVDPSIESIEDNDYSEFIKEFDLNNSLVRFFIGNNGKNKFIGYDMHHIISDATSCIILNKELEDALNGKLDNTVDLGFVYANADSFEAKFKTEYKTSHEFFKKHLDGIDEIPLLTNDINGSPGHISLPISNVCENIENLTHKLGITKNAFFNAVFAYTYSRFSSGNKVFYNFTEHGRHEDYSQNALGMFFHAIPVIIDCKNTSVEDYLISVSDLLLKSMRNDIYPYHLLVKEFNLNDNIVFEYNYDLNDVSGRDEEIMIEPIDKEPSTDFLCVVNDLKDGFLVSAEYSDNYSKETILRFLKVFKDVLIQMLEKEHLSEINYTDKEDLILLDEYNQTESPLKYSNILDAFNDNLTKYPENKLISCNDISYTYSEGAFIAQNIAERLIELGVKEKDCVGFLVERSEVYMFCILAISSIGAVHVPLDDRYPDERLEFMIKDCGCKAVIGSDKTSERVKNMTNDETVLLNISHIINDEIGNLYSLPNVYNDLTCILYTSGTTGIPKGVKITTKAIVNLSAFYQKTYGLSSEDVFAMYSSIGFDAAFKAIYSSIYAGACLDVIPDDVKLDMDALNRHFIKQNITHVDITTSVAKLLINQVNDIALDTLFTGGEKLGEFDGEINCRFADGYGPTEAYVEVATIDVKDRIDSSSVGYLVDNTKAYILDDEKRRVPIGAVGELYLSGFQIADGYLNKSEESDRAFLENPFDGGMMYRTGDMARFLPDGSLGIIGRQDSQVKIRGNRVELSEVESAIRSMKEIEDVTVDIINNNALVAYVVLTNNTQNIQEIVCDYISKHKPDYMVPSFVVQLDKIPLTVNGKVNKKALPEVDLNSLHTEYAAPTTLIEKIITNAFEKIFNQKIGINDDFIRLGGDSLTAIKLLSYLDDFNITAADILSLHTPHKIAKSIKSNQEFDLDIYTPDSGCPLNEPQLNVYLDIMANNKLDSYNIYQFIEIPKKYAINEITHALECMANIHPILGMCISNEFEVPYLIKGSTPSVSIMSHVDEDLIEKSLTKPFDLHDSLCRFIIVENEDNYLLLCCLHHIIFDDLSYDVFEKDLYALLDGESLEIDDWFLKVSAFNQQMLETEEYLEASEFFNLMLANSDDAGALLDSIYSDGPGVCESDLEYEFDFSKYGISENVLFTSAFAYTLSRFEGNENVCFNILDNGRERFSNFNSVGMYVNTLPLLVNCKNQEITSFMNNVSELVYGVMKYNYYPFRLLAGKYNLSSDILFQYVPEWFGNMEEYGDDENDFVPGISSDLIVEVHQKSEKYLLRIKHSDKYSNEFIQRFIESYKMILHDMATVDELKDINYINDRDIEFLDKNNLTQQSLLYDDILDAFNDNLSRNPENKLVSYNDISYTYNQGAFVANRIRCELIKSGISSKDCVGFLVERSELYLLSILGIMSTGATYVPLDANLPDERLAFMLNDSESKAVIVSDYTYERADNFIDEKTNILNISDIINGEIGMLSHLPVVYDDLACILYTSGTTGIPKGVKITRRALLNVSAFYSDEYNLNSADVYGLYSSIGFDMSNFIASAVLYSGACLSVIPEDIRLDMNKMNRYFTAHNVTHAFITTQVGKLFVESIEDTSLDVLLVAGEKLGKVENPNYYTLIDGYGPTESFAFISSIKNSDKIHESSVGFANYNTKYYVLDDEKRRVPIGAAGELYIAGSQVADGYLNLENETDKSFLDNPYGEGIMYRSGDMARILPDGSLGLIGRKDNQVKIRGNRVELSEIETAIHSIDFISDVTVQTVNGNELIAYVVTAGETDDLRTQISNILLKSKPEYMIPSYVVELDIIPLTVNGKVDKHALPEVDLDKLHCDYIAPSTETERKIINAFESVFNQKDIGLNDDFITLGGDSIKAIRVAALLEKNNIYCSARDILNHKTPYIIAQNMEKITKASYDTTIGEVDILPIQSYFFNEINENDYSQKFVLKSKVVLDLSILQEAFDELCNLHDMLRATYKCCDNTIIQEIRPPNTPICEIKEYENKDIEKLLDEIVGGLNINEELVKVCLIHNNGESYVAFAIHHLIIDGVSWSILIDDLTYIYKQIENNCKINLLKPYPYKSWVKDVKSLVESITDDEKQHWINLNSQLDDSTIKGKTKVFEFKVDADYDRNNMLMLSEEEYLALAISKAYKKTYDKDIIFNLESYGRDMSLADVSRTVGWFTSQYPVKVKLNNKYDDVSLISDICTLKTTFRDINHLGLNYSSLIYTSRDLEYKHCPVTFNFLSSEFIFENEMFESVNHDSHDDYLSCSEIESESYGITFNIFRQNDSYIFTGDFADETYISNKFHRFIENIRNELEFIGNYETENPVCPLSESQLGVYLDEKRYDKDTAYSVPGCFECADKSIEEMENAIHTLIEKHPILKGRILDTQDMPLLICDSYPTIEISETGDYSKLIKAFDLHKNLARFYIIENDDRPAIIYDLHHIISDATNNALIKKEFSSIFDGNFDSNIDLGFIYASRDSFESKFNPQYKSAKKFFNEEFSDIDDVRFLPNDADGSFGRVTLPIRGVKNRIDSFAHENSITISNLLNCVFAFTYSRFAGSDKVYYTFTEHGRHENYAENALGMFVRTIPIIVDCAEKSVAAYVKEVSDLILKSMSNNIYPFRLVAKDFDLNNNISFEYNYDLNDVNHIGDDIIFSDDAERVSDFSCVVNDLKDGYAVSIDHSDKYSQNTAKRFVNVFKEVLIQILDMESLKDINYISNEDIKLLDNYNNTQHSLKYADIIDAFNDNLESYPNSELVSYNERSYKYGEGAYIADKLAKKLIDLGVESQNCVSFLVERSELYMFSILGILSIGAVYVPLDDNLPDERITFMIKDTDSRVIIVSDGTYERAKGLITDNVMLLNISDIINGEMKSLKRLPAIYGNLACILYTSGTTGIPKGVEITRKSIINLSEFYINEYDFGYNDVYALFASIGFDVSMKAIFSSICTGACLTIVPNEIRLDMARLNEYFIRHEVTHTELPTQVAKLFINQIKHASLKVLTTGGEKLGDNAIDVDYRFVDSYGPTEACVEVTVIDVNNKIDSSSVGHLIPNTKVYILDNEFRRVPIGAVGELYLSGYQIARGYLNREDETANAFLHNPFDNEDGHNIMYRSGDMARILPDGTIGYIGRRDSQVKIRGNRVELSEIEATIRELEYIEDITVQTIKNNDNNEIIAYVVVNNDASDNSVKKSVCEHVEQHKPDYMIPSFVIELDEIPLNINGKVDKSALPEVNLDDLRVEYEAPRNAIELELVNAFENVFNHDKIGINDDFVRLGGDSLTAIKLLSHLGDYGITIAHILSLRTPSAIAASVKNVSLNLDIYSLESGCPLNNTQLYMYKDIIMKNKVDSYKIYSFIPIPKKYKLDCILDALNAMFEIHPILTMCVDTNYEVPYLVKGEKPSVMIESFDFKTIAGFLMSPFDLYKGMSRFLIVEDNENYYLICVFHHMIFDEMSESIIERDLFFILDGGIISHVDDSFLKLSAFHQQIQHSEEFSQITNYATSIMGNLGDVGFLLGDGSGSVPGYFELDLDVDYNLVKEFLEKVNVSENILFTGVFSYTLSQIIGKDKVFCGIIENGRDRFKDFDSVGLFINPLPLVIDCQNQSIGSYMEHVSATVYDLMKYNFYPFSLMALEFGVEPIILFQFLPDWISNEADSFNIDLPIAEMTNELMSHMKDFMVESLMEVVQNGETYSLNIYYSANYSRSMMEHFAQCYKVILSQIINAEKLFDMEEYLINVENGQ